MTLQVEEIYDLLVCRYTESCSEHTLVTQIDNIDSMDGMGTEHTIKLADGGPWGFRLSGGADYGCPLQVAKVRSNLTI